MFYFDPIVQDTINIELKHIKGSENKDDARQDAYHEIADIGPLTVEDACECARKAIHRFRMRLGRKSKRELLYTDEVGKTDRDGYPWDIPIDYESEDDELDEDGEEIEKVEYSWIDYVQPDTDRPPRHGKKYFMQMYKETCEQIAREKKQA
jgi:hypothetical protein